MTCDGLREAISAALDGEASATEAARARAHLQQCPACCEEQEWVEALGLSLRVVAHADDRSRDEAVVSVLRAEGLCGSPPAPRFQSHSRAVTQMLYGAAARLTSAIALDPMSLRPKVAAALGTFVLVSLVLHWADAGGYHVPAVGGTTITVRQPPLAPDSISTTEARPITLGAILQSRRGPAPLGWFGMKWLTGAPMRPWEKRG